MILILICSFIIIIIVIYKLLIMYVYNILYTYCMEKKTIIRIYFRHKENVIIISTLKKLKIHDIKCTR